MASNWIILENASQQGAQKLHSKVEVPQGLLGLFEEDLIKFDGICRLGKFFFLCHVWFRSDFHARLLDEARLLTCWYKGLITGQFEGFHGTACAVPVLPGGIRSTPTLMVRLGLTLSEQHFVTPYHRLPRVDQMRNTNKPYKPGRQRTALISPTHPSTAELFGLLAKWLAVVFQTAHTASPGMCADLEVFNLAEA